MRYNLRFKIFNFQKSGFTLVETLVAISILTIAVAGPLYTANRAIVAIQVSRDQLIASYLAQEGIEYVRSMRDNAYLVERASSSPSSSTAAWASFLTGANAESITQCRAATCTLDPTQTMGTGSGFSLGVCSGSSCTQMYVLNNGIYTQRNNAGGVITPFTRTIQILDIAGTSDAPGSPYPDKRVESKVSWTSRGSTYSVTIYDHLTPWR